MATRLQKQPQSPTTSTSSNVSSLPTPASGDAAWNNFFAASISSGGLDHLNNDHQRHHAHHHQVHFGCGETIEDFLFSRNEGSTTVGDCTKCESVLDTVAPSWSIADGMQHKSCPSAPVSLEPCSDDDCSINQPKVASSCCDDKHHTFASVPCTMEHSTDGTECCPQPSTGQVHDSCSTSSCIHEPVSCPFDDAFYVPQPCTDPACEVQHAEPPQQQNRLPMAEEAAVIDPCNLCDGHIAPSAPDDCRACTSHHHPIEAALAPHPDKDIYQSFQELLDCCYCADPHVDSCCSPQHTSGSGAGTITPSTVAGTTTPTTAHGDAEGFSRSSTDFWESQRSQAALWNLTHRQDCSLQLPHKHDHSGVCLNTALEASQSLHNPTEASSKLWSLQQNPCPSSHHTCRWAGCSRTFATIEDLVKHFHQAHLPHGDAVPPAAVNTWNSGAASGHFCQWDSCNQSHQVGGNGLDTSSLDPATAMLQHLLQNHVPQAVDSALPHQFCNGDDASSSSGPSAFGAVYSSRLGSPLSAATGDVLPATSRAHSPSSSSSSNGAGHACGWVGCTAVFPTHQSLTDHIANEHVGGGKSLYSCGWAGCQRAAEGKTFAQRQKILRHIQTHTGDRPFKCELCARRFSEANTLAQHMRTHTREKPYVCDYPGCGASFAVAGSLTIHKRSRHTLERPFVCTWPGCGRAFAESSNLTKHRRVHSGERPFPCKLCERKFSRPDQLQRHMKVHDTVPADGQSGSSAAKKRKTADVPLPMMIPQGMPSLTIPHGGVATT